MIDAIQLNATLEQLRNDELIRSTKEAGDLQFGPMTITWVDELD